VEVKGLEDLGRFMENLTELQIKAVEVPKGLKIPNWPKAAGDVRIKLGRRSCLYPIEISKSGMLRLATKRLRLTFCVKADGTFSFWSSALEAYYNGSDDYGNLNRMRALVLFHQFKGEILLNILVKLKAGLGDHNQVVAMVEKALEPFVPFVVADQLSS
jgi:hypothetical protein